MLSDRTNGVAPQRTNGPAIAIRLLDLDHRGITKHAARGSPLRGTARVRVQTDKFNAYTLGGYWTHFGATGWYCR